MIGLSPVSFTVTGKLPQLPHNPSIEGTASGLRPPAAPHVKR